MGGWQRSVAVGAGLVSFGWGLYRFTNQKRDLVTWTALTSGASILARQMLGKRSGLTRLIDGVVQNTDATGRKSIEKAFLKAVTTLGV